LRFGGNDFCLTSTISEIKEYFASNPYGLIGKEFDFRFKNVLVEDHLRISDCAGMQDHKIELNIKPRPGYLLMKFVSIRDSMGPSLVVIDEKQRIADLVKLSFRSSCDESFCQFSCQGEEVGFN